MNYPNRRKVGRGSSSSTDAYGDSDDPEAEKAYVQRTLEKIRDAGIPDGKEWFVKAGAFSWRNIFFYPHVTEKQGIASIPGKYARIFASAKSFNYPTGAELVIRECTHPYFQEINYAPLFPDMHEDFVPGWIDYVDGLGTLREMMPVLDEEFCRLKPVLEKEAEKKLKNIPMSDVWYIDFLYDGEKFWLIDMSLLSSVTLFDRGFFDFTFSQN